MKRLLVLVCSVLITLLLTGRLLDHSYQQYWGQFFEKLDTVVNGTSYYDGIYVGDSRVHFGINPKAVDSVSGKSSYNLGMGGATGHEMLLLSTLYLRQHPAPAYAIISVGYSGILQPVRYFENPCYYMFYPGDSLIDDRLEALGYHPGLYRWMPITKYTAFDDFNKMSIAENWKGHNILKPGGVAYRGFINNTINSFNLNQADLSAGNDTGYHAGMATLEKNIQLFKQAGTLPILIYPPATHAKPKAPIELKIDSAVQSLATTYQLPFLRYDLDSNYTEQDFSDQWHLNLKGTHQYSLQIGQDIRKYLNEKALHSNH